jgi:hypothetical protein
MGEVPNLRQMWYYVLTGFQYAHGFPLLIKICGIKEIFFIMIAREIDERINL